MLRSVCLHCFSQVDFEKYRYGKKWYIQGDAQTQRLLAKKVKCFRQNNWRFNNQYLDVKMELL